MKKLVIAVVVLLLVTAVAAWLLLSNIDSIAKNMIEEAGSEVTGTSVEVESVSIKLTSGSAALMNLSVANPPGFSDKPAFRFSEVSAVIDIGTGVVERIFTSEPEVNIEFKNGVSNFEALNKNIQASVGSDEKEKKESEGDKESDKAPVQIQIDEVEVKNARATVTLEGDEEPMEMTIERVHFENLKGSPQQIARVMLGQFVTQVAAETARRTLEKEAESYIEKKKGELEEKLGKKLEQLLN